MRKAIVARDIDKSRPRVTDSTLFIPNWKFAKLQLVTKQVSEEIVLGVQMRGLRFNGSLPGKDVLLLGSRAWAANMREWCFKVKDR